MGNVLELRGLGEAGEADRCTPHHEDVPNLRVWGGGRAIGAGTWGELVEMVRGVRG